MKRHLLAWISSAVLVLAVMAVPGPAGAVADRDCGDFGSQAAAQRFFLDHGGPRADPHRLDADGDGIACESNPCPCSTAQGGGGGPATGGGGGGADGGARDPQVRQHARIVRVIDGDTVDVRLRGGPKVRVRLVGIDTPEVYGGTECGGPAASRAAKRMLPRGTPVLLVSDPSQDRKDRYGRLLRYVMKNGSDINRLQLKRGHATVYVYDHHPFRRVRDYRGAQAAAKRHGLGVWKTCR